MVWVEDPALRELAKSKKWGWSRCVYTGFRLFFSQPLCSACVSCARVYSLDLWCMKPLYLCPLSCSVPLRFYVNFSYQCFSLWDLSSLCEWLDSHSSLFLSLPRTHSDRCVERVCVGCSGYRGGGCWQNVKWCGSAGQLSSGGSME